MNQKSKLVERANGGLHPAFFDYLRQRLANADSRILDIGCGTGAFLKRLRSGGFSAVQGVDIGSPGDGSLQESIVKADLDYQELPFQPGSFDAAVCIEVLEHIENVGHLFSQVNRLLVDGGLVLFSTPNVHSLEARIRYFLTGHLKQFDARSDPTHIYPVFLFTLKRLIQRHGFEVLDLSCFPQSGTSPTSRIGLRLAASALRALRFKEISAGDHIFCTLRKVGDRTALSQQREILITKHY